MANTPRAALPYPVASVDAPNGPAQIQELAEALDNKVVVTVASEAARNALPSVAGAIVYRSDTGDYEAYHGGSWSRIAGPLIQGKAWRTTGFSDPLVVATLTAVDFTTARVSGGITFDNTANTLTLPASGHYDVRARGYMTGNSGYFFDFRITRQRSGTTDRDVVADRRGKMTADNDEQMYFSDIIPLQLGDKLLLRCNVGSPSAAGNQRYWGASEVEGVQLFARYVAPLSGATPI